MKIVNMHEAKTNLSRLVAEATKGEGFIIARNGKPLVKVEPFEPEGQRRVGFMAGQGMVPDDFDQMGSGEIRGLFTN